MSFANAHTIGLLHLCSYAVVLASGIWTESRQCWMCMVKMRSPVPQIASHKLNLKKLGVLAQSVSPQHLDYSLGLSGCSWPVNTVVVDARLYDPNAKSICSYMTSFPIWCYCIYWWLIRYIAATSIHVLAGQAAIKLLKPKTGKKIVNLKLRFFGKQTWLFAIVC